MTIAIIGIFFLMLWLEACIMDKLFPYWPLTPSGEAFQKIVWILLIIFNVYICFAVLMLMI